MQSREQARRRLETSWEDKYVGGCMKQAILYEFHASGTARPLCVGLACYQGLFCIKCRSKLQVCWVGTTTVLKVVRAVSWLKHIWQVVWQLAGPRNRHPTALQVANWKSPWVPGFFPQEKCGPTGKISSNLTMGHRNCMCPWLMLHLKNASVQWCAQCGCKLSTKLFCLCAVMLCKTTSV